MFGIEKFFSLSFVLDPSAETYFFYFAGASSNYMLWLRLSSPSEWLKLSSLLRSSDILWLSRRNLPIRLCFI